MIIKERSEQDRWLTLMRIGAFAGCHQMANRSFFYKNYQFPVCARCTGVLIGYATALISIQVCLPSFQVGSIFCMIMFSDWFVQYMKIKESNNIRRLITGILGGYGLISCEFKLVYLLLIHFV